MASPAVVEREQAREEIRGEIREALQALPEDRFTWLVRHEPEPARDEENRRANVATLKGELARLERQLAALPAPSKRETITLKAVPVEEAIALLDELKNEQAEVARYRTAEARVRHCEEQVAWHEAAGDEHLRAWSDRALRLYQGECDDLLREEIRRRREARK